MQSSENGHGAVPKLSSFLASIIIAQPEHGWPSRSGWWHWYSTPSITHLSASMVVVSEPFGVCRPWLNAHDAQRGGSSGTFRRASHQPIEKHQPTLLEEGQERLSVGNNAL